MKIAFSGSHSTGKSTCIAAVKTHLEKQGIDVGLVSDLAVRCPLPILREHTAESSLWIASSGVASEIQSKHEHQVVLVDRPVIDAWGYMNCATRRVDKGSRAYETLKSLIGSWCPTYNVVFGTVLDQNVPIENAKGRDLDPDYRREVASAILNAYTEFSVETMPLRSGGLRAVLETVDELWSSAGHSAQT